MWSGRKDAGLGGVGDCELLEWAAQEGRIILTQDVSTLTGYAYARVVDGERMPGVVEVSTGLPVASVVEDVLLLSECSLPVEWEGRVIYLPLL